MAIINYPEYANPQHTRLFGDIGTYNYATNDITTGTPDGLINWLDIDTIEAYYKAVRDGTTPPVTEQQMIDAGFGQSCGDDDGGPPYTTFLDIPYVVHDPIDPSDPDPLANITWADIIAPTTAYERLIAELRNRIYRTHIQDNVGGDATLDGVLNNDDVNYLDYILNNGGSGGTKSTALFAIFKKEYATYSSTKNLQELLTRTYQIYRNCRLSNDSGGLQLSDLAIMRSMLDNIFGVILYPKNTAILIEQGDTATFTISLSKGPTIAGTKYVNRWTSSNREQDLQYYQQVDDYSNISVTVTDITEVVDNNSLITVYIYEPTSNNIPPTAHYTDPTYYNERSYSAMLYVGTETNRLWGDVDDNGFVNIIDVYKILNNFKYNRGDINKDGTIDSKDASDILSFYGFASTAPTKEEALVEFNKTPGPGRPFSMVDIDRADVNRDGRTDSSDASCVLTIYDGISTGKTLEQIEQETGWDILSADMDLSPETLGELSALLEEGGQSRPTTFNKHSADMILESVKNCNIVLE